MQWAKTHQQAPYNLAVSGMLSYPLRDLPVKIEDLEINRHGAYGYPPLQEALAKLSGVTPDHVVHIEGTSGANHLAMAALIEPGDEVLIEHPTYELLLSTARYLGAEVWRFSRPGMKLDPAEIARMVTPRTRLIAITNLHNPSSDFTTEAVLRRVGEIAREAGARVLVDEVYLDAAWDLAPRSSIHLGPEFVATTSLTKVYGLSGLRCGWILADPELARRMWLLNDLFGVNAAHPAERLSVIAIENLPRIAARARALLDTNRPLLNHFLESQPALECPKMERGTVCFPRLRRGSVEDFCKLLRERYETSVVPGHFFEMPDHVRVGICGETETLKAGLDRLGVALTEYFSGPHRPCN
jgi:aspartate/methionine/tyrosine aminotransferase